MNQLQAVELAPAGYRILLCHRRRAGLKRPEFHRQYQLEIAKESVGLRASLGYTRCERLYQYDHPNPLGKLMANSRKWIATSLVSVLSGHKPPPLRGKPVPLEANEFDLIEQFCWESEAHLLSTLGSAGRSAAQQLAALIRPLVDHTQVIAGPQYQVLPRTAGSPKTKLMFCLRRKPGATRSEMQKYWLHKHGTLVGSLQPGLKTSGYEQIHASMNPEIEEDIASLLRVGDEESFDGAACLWYENPEELAATFIEPHA